MMWKTNVLALLLLGSASAAQLKQETINAWTDYLAAENKVVLDRAQSSATFLWVDQDDARCQQVRAGLIVVEPMDNRNPVRAPSGLIHHWVGSVFIPNATAIDVMAVTRDYAHYKDVYKPGVADAKPLHRHAQRDEFSIRFINPSVLSRSELEGDYVSNFVRVSEKRWYSVSVTTHMQEIRNVGRPDEIRMPAGTGSGYIWRLYSTLRMEERNGGVVIEVEAVALSRDVPRALHWIADPVIRRVSRDSLEKSLQSTAAAVRLRNDNVLRSSR